MTIPGLGTFAASDFAEPAWLWFALVPVGAVACYVLMQRRSRQRLRRFSGDAAGSKPPRRRHLPLIAMVTALLALTIALAQPQKDVQVPHNRAVVMLVVDVSESMNATDVEPSRLGAAEQAASVFASHLAPGINLGLVAFSGNADVVVSPTPRHELTTKALEQLRTGQRTATGEGLLSALSTIGTLNAVLSQDASSLPPARIVLLSDGKETAPANLDSPKGAYTAARTAAEQHVPVSTITVGTPNGQIEVDGQSLAVPVDDGSMRHIADLAGGRAYDAADANDLAASYAGITDELGFQTEHIPDGTAWLRLSVVLAVLGAVAALFVNRRLPT